MFKHSVLQLHYPRKELVLPSMIRNPADFEAQWPARKQRKKIWELSTHLHCSIIGTCMTPAELRRLFHKLGHEEAVAASDHILHGNGVVIAGRQTASGKMLHKALDDKHEAALRRAGKLKTPDQLRQFWLESLEAGEISGAYWAVLTHPAVNGDLIKDAFGEVHMLSHLVGSSNRTDIQRLRHLEKELAERDNKIARQEERLREAAIERTGLHRHIERLNSELIAANGKSLGGAAAPGPATATESRMARDSRRAEALGARLGEAREHIAKLEAERDASAARQQMLERELAALEGLIEKSTGRDAGKDTGRYAGKDDETADSAARSVLYVGGRKGTVEQIRLVASGRGIDVIAHDGGVEDNFTLLAGYIGRVDLVMFPADCVSHSAVIHVKRACRELGKRYRPLRTGSIASFLSSLAEPDTHAALET